MSRPTIVRLGIILIAIALGLAGLQTSAGLTEGAREALRQVTSAAQVAPAPPAAPQASPAQSAAQPAQPQSVGDLDAAGQVVTQTFTLRAGWNTIYLEVEPINTSPLTNTGTLTQPIWIHEKSTMETVFAGLACNACLESARTWHGRSPP